MKTEPNTQVANYLLPQIRDKSRQTFLGHSDMMAYLAMMAPRLIELHRVLKERIDLSE